MSTWCFHLPCCFIVFTIMHCQCQSIWEGLFNFIVIFPSCDLYLRENPYVVSAIYWLSVLFWACLLVFIILFPFPCYFPLPLIQLHAFFWSFFLQNKLAPFRGVSLFWFLTSIAHQGTMKIQPYFLVGNFKSTLP